MYDLVYRGKMFLDDRITEGVVVVEDGVIRGVHGPGYSADAEVVLDYTGRPGVILCPGFIDMHVHLRGLELSYKEDEETGTRAAVMGGVTAVMDMPNTKPRLIDPRALSEKLANLEAKSYTDYGVYAGIPMDPSVARKLAEPRGVVGFKVYPEDMERGEAVEAAVREAAHRGLLIVVHPELPWMIDESSVPGTRWRKRGLDAELGSLDWFHGRYGALGARIHYTHITSRETAARAGKLGATVDTCPHYLYLTSEDEERLGCLAKVNPPLRPRNIVESLRDALAEGLIDAVSSDHAPHTLHEKQASFDKCPPGIIGVETLAPLMLTLANRHLVSIEDVIVMLSKAPANILGLRDLGRVFPGYRANLTIIDTEKKGTIRGDELHSKHTHTPYEGFPYIGSPIATIVGGRLVVLEGQLFEKPGIGRPVATAHGEQGSQEEPGKTVFE